MWLAGLPAAVCGWKLEAVKHTGSNPPVLEGAGYNEVYTAAAGQLYTTKRTALQRLMFIGTQCDLWGKPDGTGHEKVSRGKFPRLIFSLIPSLSECHISVGCADLIRDIALN